MEYSYDISVENQTDQDICLSYLNDLDDQVPRLRIWDSIRRKKDGTYIRYDRKHELEQVVLQSTRYENIEGFAVLHSGGKVLVRAGYKWFNGNPILITRRQSGEEASEPFTGEAFDFSDEVYLTADVWTIECNHVSSPPVEEFISVDTPGFLFEKAGDP